MAQITNARAIILCNSVVDALDGGGGPGLLRLYSGSAPAAADAAPTGTLLAELQLSSTAFGDAVDANPGATATANDITDDSAANANGTVGYARLVDAAGGNAIQLTVGVGSGELQLLTLTIVMGQPVAIDSLTVTHGE